MYVCMNYVRIYNMFIVHMRVSYVCIAISKKTESWITQ